MLFAHVAEVVHEAERLAVENQGAAALQKLRELSLDEFGEVLLGMPNAELPHLSAILPAMASEEVQLQWTGASGHTLLRQSLSFIRVVWRIYEGVTSRRLRDAEVLDYGVGYGRLLRLMLYFCDPSRLTGIDPWDKSIELCRAARIPAKLEISDYLPTSLPVDGKTFDLAYAMSIFTHTSLRASKTALQALQDVLKPGGILVATIRPVEYWQYCGYAKGDEEAALIAAHKEHGFAFRAHVGRPPVDGDVTYGDTSMSVEGFANLIPGWRLADVERSLEDPYQRIISLQKA